jgi:hypothetical protein
MMSCRVFFIEAKGNANQIESLRTLHFGLSLNRFITPARAQQADLHGRDLMRCIDILDLVRDGLLLDTLLSLRQSWSALLATESDVRGLTAPKLFRSERARNAR